MYGASIESLNAAGIALRRAASVCCHGSRESPASCACLMRSYCMGLSSGKNKGERQRRLAVGTLNAPVTVTLASVTLHGTICHNILFRTTTDRTPPRSTTPGVTSGWNGELGKHCTMVSLRVPSRPLPTF